MINRMIQKAVITGPTGAIGQALCRELAENGVQVYAVCRPGSARAVALPQCSNIIRVDCDISQLQNLPALIPEKIDAFFHFGWVNTTGVGRDNMPSQIRNIQYTIDAVHASKALNSQVFVGAGSQAEYGRVEEVLRADTPCFPENGYGMAKLCAGQMSRQECQKLGMDHIWARILSVYGPGDGPMTMITSVIKQLLKGERPALTEGVQLWDYLYSQDAARAFRLMAEHGQNSRTYLLGSGQTHELRTYIEILRDSIDPHLPLGLGEIPYGPQQVMHLQADISQLQADTGFLPQIPFEMGIRYTVQSIAGGVNDE